MAIDLISVSASKASSIDRDENTTDGVLIAVQIWRLVLEFWVTLRVRKPYV